MTGLLTIVVTGCAPQNQANVPIQAIAEVDQGVIDIHINQVAFELAGPKSAIVTSNRNVDLSGQAFTVISADSVVFNGTLVKLTEFNDWQSGTQQSSTPESEKSALNYYQAEFSELSQIGQYRLQTGGHKQELLSAEFVVKEQALFKETINAILAYFKYSRNDERYTWQQDQHIRIFDTDRYVDVRGGWNDAGGDTGKYLSHLSYSNFLNPQQLALVGWALSYSYQSMPTTYADLGLDKKIIEEVFWGADYLHRILDEDGYFYMTVFDQWHAEGAERVVTAYVGADGIYSEDYQAAFRQGAGVAIAALARAATLAKQTSLQGEFSAKQYLADAEKGFRHLEKNNVNYCDDGQENIIDDYTALLAAVELYRATNNDYYLKAARYRASNLSKRITTDGWFISNNVDSDNLRPFYHAAEAGFPVFSLTQYLAIENEQSLIQTAKATITKNLSYQLAVNSKVANPFNYARQPFKTYKNKQLDTQFQEGFFIPHANETEYWWQGESARLSSLAVAALAGGKEVFADSSNRFGVKGELAIFAQNQLDWTLGRNPYNLCMLNGFGINNPVAYSGLDMVKGGISNGITGAKNSDSGRGIEFGPETDWHNWRWVEQWLPHSTWFLLATSEMAQSIK